MVKEKNKKNLTNEDWLKQKYIFNSKYTIDAETKQKNINKVSIAVKREYTDYVHLSDKFLQKYFK